MKRLLVVDDERQILELLALTLSMRGFEVTTALSGPQALDLARAAAPAGGFDLIVLDVVMSPWDGFETARQLGALPGTPAPIIFLTGLAGDEARARGENLGVAYLLKPFRPSQLLEAIERALTRPGAAKL